MEKTTKKIICFFAYNWIKISISDAIKAPFSRLLFNSLLDISQGLFVFLCSFPFHKKQVQKHIHLQKCTRSRKTDKSGSSERLYAARLKTEERE